MAKEKKEGIPVKVEPARAVSPFEEMERWFEDFLRTPFPALFRAPWRPRLRWPEMEEFAPIVDIFEEGDDVVVKAEVPGMHKEDLDVKLEDDMITISGEKKAEEKIEKKDYYRFERSYGSFCRAFRLPTEVQTEKAKAKFKDGVLEIRVPKTEEAKKKAKSIAIE